MQRYDTVAISGMGGIGKTELAVQYARTHLKQQTYPGGVVWLKAREDIATQIVLFARSLPMLQPPDDFELAEKVKFYWRNWQEAKTLVILDDVQDYGAIKSLLPVDPRFKILLTTWLTLQRPIEDFEITVLSEGKAIELLRAIVTQDEETTDPRLLEEVGDLEQQLCHLLGYLPLGIELVGRYLVWDKDVTLTILLQRLQEKRTDAIALKQTYPGMTLELGVAAAFELSWQTLSPPAQQLACLLSLFALAEIPWTLVEACLREADAEELQCLRNNELVGLHLLERTGQGTYQLHQLLRDFFAAKREQIAEPEEMQQWIKQIVEALDRAFPTVEFQTWQECDRLLPHVQAIWQHLKQHPYNSVSLARLLNQTGYYLSEQGRYSEAELLITKAFTIVKHQLIGDHLAVAQSLNNLAELYASQRRYLEARPLYIRALVILKRRLGSDQLYLAIIFNNLAHVYASQKHYSKAESLYIRALDIQKRHLAEDHPDIATSLNNLAGIYRAQGRYAKAELLYERSLEIRERQLEADPLSVAQSLNNLAELYRMQGRYAEAEPLYLRALALLFQCLRTDHPNMQAVWQNFQRFLQAVIEAGETGQLSDHPVTQGALMEMRERNRE